jgi:hypothetical protein
MRNFEYKSIYENYYYYFLFIYLFFPPMYSFVNIYKYFLIILGLGPTRKPNRLFNLGP